jgi:putative FmdB family regulatory protein
MPIYAYRCESCGFEKDVLQKMSDAPLTQCPECKSEAFRKQVTAAGFQLKGSGWYVTDFRGGSKGAGAAANGQKDSGESKTAPGDSGTATGTASSASATSAASTGGSGAGGSTGSGTAASSTADA